MIVAQAIGAIAGAFGASGAGAFLTQTLVGRLLVSVAATAIMRVLQGGESQTREPGIATTFTATGGVNPASFLIGTYATAGTLVCPPMSHGTVDGTPNAYLTFVVALSDAPGQDLKRVMVNDEYLEFFPTPHPDLGFRAAGRFAGYLWVKYYDGTQTAADPHLLATYGSYPERPWSADMVGEGIAYAILTFRFNRELWTGRPTFRFELGGLPLYDPRLDTTAGGTGPQRWSLPATWAPSDNPMVQVYNILRGIRLPGGFVWGGKATAEELPFDDWAAAMDECDVPAPDGEGGTIPQYRAGYEVRVDTQPKAVIEELLKACSGQIAEAGGLWKPRVGPPGLPVWFMTDGDIVISRPSELDPFPGLEGSFNGAHASYPEPAALWESRDAPPVYRPDLEEIDDGQRLIADLALPAVSEVRQVDRLLRAWIEEERRWRRHGLTLPPDAAILEPLDALAWTSARNGYGDKLFEVAEIAEDLLTGLQRVSMRERDPADYDFPATVALPAPIRSTVPVAPAPQGVPGWGVGPASTGRPGIAVVWAPEDLDDVRGLRIAVRLAATEAVVARSYLSGRVASTVIAEGLLPATDYQVQGELDVDRPTAPTAWTAVTTPAVYLTAEDLAAEIRDAVETLNAWIDGGVMDLPLDLDDIRARAEERLDDAISQADRIRLVQDRVSAAITEATELAARAAIDGAELRRTLSAEIADTAARFDETISVLTGSEFAAVQRLTVLEASTANLGASVTTLEQAIVDGDTALGQLIAEISVGSAVQFDHARIWYFDSAVEGWSGVPTAPSVAVPGWLRPAAASYVLSPSGLGVPAITYSQVRARLRRTGSPTWQGWIWWAGEGEGWNSARRVTLGEPTWEGGIGLITATPGWSGTIDRIRVELTSGADASNYVEIDWIAVGRPAPGASSADLVTESLARIAEDEALASQITALDTSLTSLSGTVTGQAAALSTLDGRVTETEDGIDAAAGRLDALEATVEDPTTGLAAVATAVDDLNARVTTTEGGVTTEAAQVRGLRSTVQTLGGQAIDAAARGLLDDQLLRTYTASASQQLATRVDLTDGQVAVLAEAVTLLQAAIPGLATADALSALTTTVTTQGGLLSALSSSVTALEVTVPTLATASALSTLAATVTTQGDAISSLSSAVTSLQTTVPTLATATALSSLSTQVNNTKGATADALLALGATLGDTTAETRFRATVEATPAGASARIGLKATATGTEGDARTAALFLDAMPGNASRVVVQADRFAVVNGANTVTPFIVAGGVTRLDPARILLTGDVTVDGSFQVTGPMIVNGAASRSRLLSSLAAPVTITGETAATANTISTTATGVAGQFSAFVNGADGRAVNPIELDIQIAGFGTTDPIAFLVFQAMVGGVWQTIAAATTSGGVHDPLKVWFPSVSLGFPIQQLTRVYVDGAGLDPSAWQQMRMRAFRFTPSVDLTIYGLTCAVRQINK